MSYHPAEESAPPRLGRYELLGQLATGGMAEIHLARLAGEAGFEKIVVVKRLLPELVASRAFVAMFLEEGKLVARIDHPNVCAVHELGREGAEYFLVMPYLDGVPASDFIARPREPDRIRQLRVACGIATQACAGLHHAHELRGTDGEPLGLVHRDVSPSNLFVTTAGVVKVLDFGIAKVRGAAETEAGTIKGKTQYMAPEQLLGEALDRRCDVFALGIVLFELATHQRLFQRDSDYLAARAILEEPIPRADAVDPAVPAPLADVIEKALARTRDARFSDARELARAIEEAMAPHGGVATAEQIAGALSAWHGEELSAQRTRQARVISGARSRATGTAAAAATRTATATPIDVATGATGPATDVATVPHPRARAPLRPGRVAVLAAASAGLVVGLGALILWGIGERPHHAAPPDAALAAAALAVAAVTHDAPAAPPPDAGPPDARSPADAASAAAADAPDRPIRRTGTFSIDSNPYATIFVDDHRLGVTPILRHPLAAGRHRIRAVLRDGRAKRLVVDVPAGRAARPVVLTW